MLNTLNSPSRVERTAKSRQQTMKLKTPAVFQLSEAPSLSKAHFCRLVLRAWIRQVEQACLYNDAARVVNKSGVWGWQILEQ